jgi:hypothetical protein
MKGFLDIFRLGLSRFLLFSSSLLLLVISVSTPTHAISNFDAVTFTDHAQLGNSNCSNSTYKSANHSSDYKTILAGITTANAVNMVAIMSNTDYTYTVSNISGYNDGSYHGDVVDIFATRNAVPRVSGSTLVDHVPYQHSDQQYLAINSSFNAGDYAEVILSVNASCDGFKDLNTAIGQVSFALSNYPYSWLIPVYDPYSSSQLKVWYTTAPFTAPSGYAGTQPASSDVVNVNVDFLINFKVDGSNHNFDAYYTGKTTNPVSTLPDPSSVFWSVIDLSDACAPSDPRQQCTFAGLGYVPVCNSVNLTTDKHYDQTQCNGYQFQPTHNYAVTSGYTYGLGSTVVKGYNITYKTVIYDLPFTGNYSLDSTHCQPASISAGDYGIGTTCTGPAIVDCSTIGDFPTRINCAVQASFSTGIINPSINAVKGLITSVIVPPSPPCGFSLGSANISGYNFDTTSFAPTLCRTTTDIRSHFPIVLIAINFLFAVFILYLIIKIFNKLTNPHDNDIIQGYGR